MRSFITGIILVFAFILQTTLIQYIELWNVKPNLIIVIIISLALIRGSVKGAVIGLCGGILMDLFLAKGFGLNSLLCMYIGIIAGLISTRFVKESYFVATLFTFLLSFVYELSFFFLRFYIWGETQFLFFIKNTIIPQSIYNCILVIPIYHFIMKINNWLEKRFKISRKY